MHQDFTPVPNFFFDRQVQDLSAAELRVLLYIFRRTFGFQRQGDAISYRQFLQGITTREGKVIDRGAGVSERSLRRALETLTACGYIRKQNRQKNGGSYQTTFYELNDQSYTLPAESQEASGNAPEGGSGKSSQPSGNAPEAGSGNLPEAQAQGGERGSGISDRAGGPPGKFAGGGSGNLPDTIDSINQNKADDQSNHEDWQEMQDLIRQAGVAPETAHRLARQLVQSGRTARYLRGWLEWLGQQPGIARKEAYLVRVLNRNSDLPLLPRLGDLPYRVPASPADRHRPRSGRAQDSLDRSKFAPGGKYHYLVRESAR